MRPSLGDGSWEPLGSGEAAIALKGDCWVQGFPRNVQCGCLHPAEASSNSSLASQQGHSLHYMPSFAHATMLPKATEVLEAGLPRERLGTTA